MTLILQRYGVVKVHDRIRPPCPALDVPKYRIKWCLMAHITHLLDHPTAMSCTEYAWRKLLLASQWH